MGRKPWSPSCRIFLGRAGDRTEVSLCVGLVGLGGCHSKFFSSAKGMGERKSFVLFVCAENVCEMHLFFFVHKLLLLPFLPLQVTGASGQPARAPATPGALVVRHPHPLTHTHTPNNNKNVQIEDIATMTHKSTMFAHNIASLFRKGGHTHKTKMETQTTHTMNK